MRWQGATLAEVIADHARERPSALAVRFIEPGGTSLADSTIATLDYSELAQRAWGVAEVLAAQSAPGERALLLCPPGVHYVVALFGCFTSGVVAVPAYPPLSAGLDERLARLIADSAPSAILTITPLAGLCEPLCGLASSSRRPSRLVLLDEVEAREWTGNAHTPAARDLALLQYTSGSTGDPAGVMLTHANLLANVSTLVSHVGFTSNDRGVLWLPPYHDMGLIGAILTCVVMGAQTTLMSPLSFLARPLLWLEALSRYKGTYSGAPNFAYDLCVRKVTSEQAAALDLSAWRCAANGAEPARLETMERFTEHFAAAGFRRSTFMPGYGLAEATLVVTANRLSEGSARTTRLTRGDNGARDRFALSTKEAVSLGVPDADAILLIVDPQTRRALPDGQEGEIWFHGRSVGIGYWGNDEKSRSTFGAMLADDPDGLCYLRTGDLGVLRDGELYFTGRIKDLIIVRGQNYHPHDIELAATGADPHLRPGCLAAFAAPHGDGEGEAVVLVAELASRPEDGDTAALFERVCGHVARAVGLVPEELVLIERGAIPKTSSGKIRRTATRAAYLAGSLPVIAVHRRSQPLGDADDPVPGRQVPQTRASELVVDELGRLLGELPAEAVEDGRTFRELGLESRGAVELSVRLSAATGLGLPETLCFDHPTPAAVIAHIAERLRGRGRQPAKFSGPIEQARAEPIAIVGMACRFPGGADSPERLWALVEQGIDSIAPFPRDRGWDLERLLAEDSEQPGGSLAHAGGFVDGAADFDADFFGISARQAAAIDPQQRQLLEVAWQALEDAGIDPTSLAGSATAVYVGVSSLDHALRLGNELARELEGHLITGAAASAISGRLSYTLGLRGPAVTVDTACSSSLVALHEACRALSAGECSLALSGGVTILSTPAIFTGFSRQGALAPDGRCKPFAASADGAGFAEGVGVLVLERLAEARRRGHEVLALVRSSAVNQDGRSNGFTAPSGLAQEEVIRAALQRAGLAGAEIDAVEAHGTGTRLGDPIEAQALIATYGQDRKEPLWVGSVKGNIGHTQAAAGVAGVIKMVMAMRHGVLPRSLHAQAPTPQVDWQSGAIGLLSSARRWRSGTRPRRAGVSSFGISGTNAHVILEGVRPRARRSSRKAPIALPFLLSARSDSALRGQAEHLREHIEQNDQLAPLDVAYTLARGRARMDHRAAIIAMDHAELRCGLDALIEGRPVEGLLRARARMPAKTAFVFGGQGAQWEGMARELMASSAVFARRIRACSRALSRHLDWSLEELLLGQADTPTLDRPDVVQPALWAVMIALAELWRSFGVQPAMVLGHSQGEIAAAQIAGGLSLDDAALLVAARGRLLGELAQGGGMVSLALDAGTATMLAQRWPGRVWVAATNGPSATVLSGDPDALQQLLELCAEEGTLARRIPVTFASHSPAVEVLREQLVRALAPIRPRRGKVPFVSCLSAEVIDTARLDGEYWYRSLREPVRFADATRTLLRAGCTTLIEISPQAVLTLAMQETIEEEQSGERTSVIASLRRGQGDRQSFLEALAAAHVRGVAVDWRPHFQTRRGRLVRLPTYPFERKRHWLTPQPERSPTGGLNAGPGAHPLLEAGGSLAEQDGWLAFGAVAAESHPWLEESNLGGCAVLPAGALLELALHAGREVGAEEVAQLTIEAPVMLPERGAIELQVSVGERNREGRRALLIAARADCSAGEQDGEWRRCAVGVLAPCAPLALSGAPARAWPPPGARAIALDHLQDRLAEHGVGHGRALERARSAWQLGEELFVELDPVPALPSLPIDPVLLDAIVVGAPVQIGQPVWSRPPLAYAWSGVRALAPAQSPLRVRLTLGDGELALAAEDQDGIEVLSVAQVKLRALDPEELRRSAADQRELLLALRWETAGAPARRAGQVELGVLADGQLGAVDGLRFPDLQSVAQAQAHGRAPRVLLVPVNGAGGSTEAIHACTRRILVLLKSWLTDEQLGTLRLVVLTRGAVAARAQEVPELAGAAVWGLVRGAQSEHPGRFTLVDIDDAETSWRALKQALALEEPQLAIRQGELLVPRLTPLLEPVGRDRTLFDPAGTVLITGGTGQLGQLFARHLARAHGVRHLLLASRSGAAAEGAQELARELGELGCQVRVVACDVSDRRALGRLVSGVPQEAPLRAVIHAAGIADEGLIESLDGKRLKRVMAPKVEAALGLDALTAGLKLSAFVLISSAVGILGVDGHANYGAANSVLDAIAQSRRARGLPAQSLAWGLWQGDSGLWRGDSAAGRASRADALAQLQAQIHSRLGVLALAPERGLALFDEALRADDPFLAPVRVDMDALRANAQVDAISPVLAKLLPRRARRAELASGLRRRLRSAAAESREEIIATLLCEELAWVLGCEASGISGERNLVELGGESLDALALRNRLEARTGVRLSMRALYRESLNALARRLLDDMQVDQARPAARSERATVLRTLLTSAREQGRVPELLGTLIDTARLRASFDAVERLPRAVPLTDCERVPQLICIPSFMPGSGPAQFARLARGFEGRRKLTALELPGWQIEEPMPASWSVAIEALGGAVRSASGEDPYVLLGYSSGGSLAHAVAERCECEGAGPAGVIMIDSYAVGEDAGSVVGTVIGELLDRSREYLEIDDGELIAMASYLRLASEWQPGLVRAPALHLRARVPLARLPDPQPLRAPFGASQSERTLDADHFTIIEGGAQASALAIEQWLTQTLGDSDEGGAKSALAGTSSGAPGPGQGG